MQIAHLINPVVVSPSSDLHAAQPVTFESMRRARDFAHGIIDVDLVTAQYTEDRPLVPDGYRMTPDLTRSVLDCGHFERERRLPLVAELFDRLAQHTTAEYVIYSNVDIALMPHFYLFVREQIERGYDFFMINRRTISNVYTSPTELPMMYAQLGEDHPGKDCFVLERSLLSRIDVGRTCVGARHVAAVISANLIAYSRRFTVFEREHVTFHLGDDQAWKRPEQDEYGRFNAGEAVPILDHLLVLPAVVQDKERLEYIRRRRRRAQRMLDEVT